MQEIINPLVEFFLLIFFIWRHRFYILKRRIHICKFGIVSYLAEQSTGPTLFGGGKGVGRERVKFKSMRD